MTLNAIRLNPQLHQEHHRALLRYLTDESTLSHKEWVTLIEAVDVLDASVVVVDGQEQTFRQFYSQRIDEQFADPFLASLLTLADVERDGRRVQAEAARKICELLDTTEGFSRDDNDCRTLLIYCLYWWAAFARGYIFEATIFRDLSASGIQFIPHDVTNRNERFAPYDLRLLELRGDIKYTTYFLTTEHLKNPVSDFFITRWYLADRRQWLPVVILRETAWQILSTDTTAFGSTKRQTATLEEVATILPKAACFTIDSIMLTAFGYEQWKQRILQIQSMRGE